MQLPKIEIQDDETYGGEGAIKIALTVPVGQYSDTRLTLHINMETKSVSSGWQTGEL